MAYRFARIVFCLLGPVLLYGSIPVPGKLLIRTPLLQGAWTEGDPMVPVPGRPGQEQPTEFPGGPRPLHKVMPVYPDELRSRGIEGRVELLVGVDETGTVQGVKVLESLHPYLDYAAVQALKLWKFEPVIQGGKPVPVVVTMVVNFSREAYRRMEEAAADKMVPAADTASPAGRALGVILEKSAAYCQKLTDSALDYICEETTRDVLYHFWTREELEKTTVVTSLVSGDGSISRLGISFVPFKNPKRTERNEYVCDYLLVKKGERIEDRRIVLKENGRPLPDRAKLLEEKRLSTLLPFLAPVRLVGRERQALFDYRLLKEERVKGRAAHVVEALPRTGDPGGIESGRVWIDRRTYRVLKIETTGVPVEGYEDVLGEIIRYNLKPRFVTTYLYEAQKGGLAFPSQAEIRVDYPAWDSPGAYVEKIRTSVRYGSYKFFIVDTTSEVKK